MKLYIFHSQENVVCALYWEMKLKKYIEVEKTKLGESFIEELSNNFDFGSIKEIYFRNSYSAWNASRLIVLFIKCCHVFGNSTIYLKTFNKDVKDKLQELKIFSCLEFKLVKNINELKPLYKQCKSINI